MFDDNILHLRIPFEFSIPFFSAKSDSLNEDVIILDDDSDVEEKPKVPPKTRDVESSDDEDVSIIYESKIAYNDTEIKKEKSQMAPANADDDDDDDDDCVIVSDDDKPREKLNGSGASVGQKRKSDESPVFMERVAAVNGAASDHSSHSSGGRNFEIIETDDGEVDGDDESIISRQKRVKRHLIVDSDSSMNESMVDVHVEQEKSAHNETKEQVASKSPAKKKRKSVAVVKRTVSPDLYSDGQSPSPPTTSDEDEAQRNLEEAAYDEAFENNDDVDESVIEQTILEARSDPADGDHGDSLIVDDSEEEEEEASELHSYRKTGNFDDFLMDDMNSTSEVVEDSDN